MPQGPEEITRHCPLTVWLTGLSGAGKTTLAQKTKEVLSDAHVLAQVVDGDVMRQGICRGLGFTQEDREENLRRVSETACLLTSSGLVTIVATISPQAEAREQAREMHEKRGLPFWEVYVSTPLQVCEDRDPKGLYKKARSGDIPHFTGVSAGYDVPTSPDLVMDMSDQPEENARILADLILSAVRYH